MDRRKVSLSPTLTRRELKLNIGQLLIIGFDGTAWVGHVSAPCLIMMAVAVVKKKLMRWSCESK